MNVCQSGNDRDMSAPLEGTILRTYLRRFFSRNTAAARTRGIAAGGRGRDAERGVELEAEGELEAELKVPMGAELVVEFELECTTVETTKCSELSAWLIKRSLRIM